MEICADGSKQFGFWKDGKINGIATSLGTNGRMYKGQLKDDRKHGFGIWQNTKFEKYYGTWKDDKAYGEGAWIDAEGVLMAEGLFIDDWIRFKGNINVS